MQSVKLYMDSVYTTPVSEYGKTVDVYVGSYTCRVQFGTGETFTGKGEGIYRFCLEPETGSLKPVTVIKGVANPSFLTLDRAQSMLYCVNELEEHDGGAGGTVSSFRLTGEGSAPVNCQPTRGTDPCHVVLTPDGRCLCVSNYTSGSVSVFPILPDGTIGECIQCFAHSGSGRDAARQSGPHCHSMFFSKDGRYAFSVDLGTDALLCYRLLPGQGGLTALPEKTFRMTPGDGPRVCCFNSGGDRLYVANELSNSVSVLSFDQRECTFALIQTISSLPPQEEGRDCSFAMIQLSADGRFLYGSNRGHNSIVMFDVDRESGRLTYSGCCGCGGVTPRSFTIDPSGRYLLCANQDSDTVAVFSVDQENGRLTMTDVLEVGSPVYVVAVEREG